MTKLTREGLYEMVWTTPITKMAEELKVSGTAIAKICMKLDVPRPPRGYWARLRHGYKVDKPQLPKATAETQTTYELNAPEPRHHRVRVGVPELTDAPRIAVPEKLGRPHPAVAVLKSMYAGLRKDDFGRIGQQNKAMQVTPSSMSRSYRLLNALFRELHKRGHTVSERYGALEMRVDGEVMEVSLFEPTTRTDNPKPNGYPRWIYHATGRLTLTLFAPGCYRLRQQWADGKTTSLEDKLDEIAAVIEHMPALIRAERREQQLQEQRWALARLRQKRENDVIKFTHARAQAVDQLVQDLDKADRIRALIGEIERQAGAPTRSRRLARWAKQYADHLDPRLVTRLASLDLDLEPDEYIDY